MGPAQVTSQKSKAGITFNELGNSTSTFGLILIHGWGCQKSDYDGLFDYFLETHKQDLDDIRIICPDLPGHGSTPKEICPGPSITKFAESIIDLLKEIGLRGVVLVGHSMGVRIVSEIWRLSNKGGDLKVEALVFIDGSDYRHRPTIAFDREDSRSASLSEEEIAVMKAKVFEKMFSPATPESFRLSTIEHVGSRDKAYSEALRESMIAYDRGWMEGTMEALGKDGGTKLLNLQSSDASSGERRALREGEQSVWMEWLEETVKGSRGVVVPGSAHFPHVDFPERVGGEVWEFVRKCK